MFTGIIREVGTLLEKKTHASHVSFKISATTVRPKPGDSIAINGVCLTAIEIADDGFWVDLVAETLQKTNLGELEQGALINLEPSLRVGEGLDGHFVTGHIDTVAKITMIDEHGLSVAIPDPYIKYMTPKGSITINGVALTIVEVTERANNVTVALIPYTRAHTNLGQLKSDDRVTIEVDLIARYLEKLSR